MSETSQGLGWWQASDGRWYPPGAGDAASDGNGPSPEMAVPGGASGPPAETPAATPEAAKAGEQTAPAGAVSDPGPEGQSPATVAEAQAPPSPGEPPADSPGVPDADGNEVSPPDGSRRIVLAAVLGVVAMAVTAAVVFVLVARSTTGPAAVGPPATDAPSVPTTVPRDHGPQNNLVRAVTTLKTQYAYLGTYAFVTIPGLVQREPTISWVTGATPVDRPGQVSVAVSPQSALLATRSADGACWYALDAETGSTALTQYQLPGPAMYFNMAHTTTCDGQSAPMNGWGETFPQA